MDDRCARIAEVSDNFPSVEACHVQDGMFEVTLQKQRTTTIKQTIQKANKQTQTNKNMYEVTQSHLPIYFSCLIGSCTEALRVVCRSRRNTYEVTLRTLMASNTEYSLVVRWPVVAGAMAPDEVNWHLETFRIYENVLVSLQRFTPWRHRYRDYLANRVDDAEGALVGLALTPRDIYIYIYI